MPTLTTKLKSKVVDACARVLSSDARHMRSIDVSGTPRCRLQSDAAHLDAAIHWLCRAQEVGTDDGVAAMFSLIEGWTGSYPETTGYLIPTFFDAADAHASEDLRHRAAAMADWLVTCQADDGSFPGSFIGRLEGPRVFNTGQAVFGLLRASTELDDERFGQAAVRAGDWLVRVQDADGAWRRYTHNGVVHTYNVRTAWALLRLADAARELRYRRAALHNAEWALEQQSADGWFEHNGFIPGHRVTLHTVAYAARGLLEIGLSCGDERFVDAARRTDAALTRLQRPDGTLPGAFDAHWRSPAEWRCLTGEAQVAIIRLRLAEPGAERAACLLLDRVKEAQWMDESSPDLHGGLTGSVPIHAPYERYCLVNWAAKFLIDALLLKGRLGR